nr:unnamed protein product [Callosobruchus analis]
MGGGGSPISVLGHHHMTTHESGSHHHHGVIPHAPTTPLHHEPLEKLKRGESVPKCSKSGHTCAEFSIT